MKATIEERVFHFHQPAGTSRGVYTERRSWLIHLSDGHREGVGECAPLPRLSCDDMPPEAYTRVLYNMCQQFCQTGQIDYESMRDYPSMLFGLETAAKALSVERLALRDFSPASESKVAQRSTLNVQLFDTPFSRGEEGIPINGLVWMGTHDEMLRRMEQKLEQGYRCVKLKIGAIGFDEELDLLRRIRQRFGPREVELRVDANGAFDPQPGRNGGCALEDALYKLELLSQYALHSIEQPIRQGQWADMAELCRDAPLPIALDEELIGVNDAEQKRQLLRIIKPAFIVLKPSLHGGMSGCREWVGIAREEGVGSWITSALESNVGLNAIAQLCSDIYGPGITMPQGLGTGQLFTDNIDMGLEIRGCALWRKRLA